MSEENPHVLKALAKTISKIDKRMAEVAARPTVQTGTITKVASDGKVDFVLDNGKKISGYEAISQHIQEVGRKILVGMNGDEPVVMLADLIAARTIIADMIQAGAITAKEITALLKLEVGQALESTNYQTGVSGFHLDASGHVEIGDLLARGLISATNGPSVLRNGTFDQDISDWAASGGGASLSLETTLAQIFAGAGALAFTTIDGTERYAATPETIAGGLYPVDIERAYHLEGWFKPPAVGDRVKLSIAWWDSAGGFISESAGDYVTGVTAYTRAFVHGEPPVNATGSGSSTYVPAADAVVLFATGTPDASTLFTNVDEGSPSSSDYIFPQFSGIAGGYLARSSITAGAMAGKAITKLSVTYYVARGAGFANQSIIPAIRIGSTDYDADGHVLSVSSPSYDIGAVHPSFESLTITWDKNPATGLVWTAAEIEDFRVGRNNSFGGQLYTDDAGQGAVIVAMKFVPSWTADAGTARYMSVRAYYDALSAGGGTVRIDEVMLMPHSAIFGGIIKAAAFRGPDGDATYQIQGSPRLVTSSTSRYGATVRRTTNQLVNNGTNAAITFPIVDYDPAGLIVSGLFTVPAGQGGLYVFSVQMSVDASPGGGFGSSILFYDGTVTYKVPMTGSNDNSGSHALTRWMNAGETMQALFRNDTGGGLNVNPARWDAYRVMSG